MAVSRELGERAAVIHGHEEPTVIQGGHILIDEHPNARGHAGGQVLVLNKNTKWRLLLFRLHLRAADPGIHGVAAHPSRALAHGEISGTMKGQRLWSVR